MIEQESSAAADLRPVRTELLTFKPDKRADRGRSSWVELLRQAGLEAVHWSTIGRANARDAEIMAWAATNGHVV